MVLVRRGLKDDLEDLKLRPKLLSALRAGIMTGVNLPEAAWMENRVGSSYADGLIMTGNRNLYRDLLSPVCRQYFVQGVTIDCLFDFLDLTRLLRDVFTKIYVG